MQLIENSQGNYRFLTGIAPYSAGVVALAGYEIVRVTLQTPAPYRQGFTLIDQHLRAQGRPRQALCAVELRLPKPLTFAGFNEFNQGYRALLADWDILLGEQNPVARTNIAPAIYPPTEPSLYAFSYTIPVSSSPVSSSPVSTILGTDAQQTPTFIVAGAGDLRDQAQLANTAVVRPGETSANALREKAACVMQVMQARLTGLGMTWAQATAVDVYTAQPLHSFLHAEILSVIGAATTHGIHWYYSHPPIADLAFEMDIRGVHQEWRL